MLIVVWWGKRANKAGNIKVLHITALMIPFIPILWLVNTSVWWFCAAQVYSGFAWAGFNLCAGLFIWDAAPQENRSRYITLFAALGAFGSPWEQLLVAIWDLIYHQSQAVISLHFSSYPAS